MLANIYIARLEKELCNKCILDPKFKWPILFKRVIDDGFLGFWWYKRRNGILEYAIQYVEGEETLVVANGTINPPPATSDPHSW